MWCLWLTGRIYTGTYSNVRSFFLPRFFPAVFPSDCRALLTCQYQPDRCHVLLERRINVCTHVHLHWHAHCQDATVQKYNHTRFWFRSQFYFCFFFVLFFSILWNTNFKKKCIQIKSYKGQNQNLWNSIITSGVESKNQWEQSGYLHKGHILILPIAMCDTLLHVFRGCVANQCVRVCVCVHACVCF